VVVVVTVVVVGGRVVVTVVVVVDGTVVVGGVVVAAGVVVAGALVVGGPAPEVSAVCANTAWIPDVENVAMTGAANPATTNFFTKERRPSSTSDNSGSAGSSSIRTPFPFFVNGRELPGMLPGRQGSNKHGRVRDGPRDQAPAPGQPDQGGDLP
jgi:hypothetical protein